jgi:hypothetical protein
MKTEPHSILAEHFHVVTLYAILWAKDKIFVKSGHQPLIQYVLRLAVFAQPQWVYRTPG